MATKTPEPTGGKQATASGSTTSKASAGKAKAKSNTQTVKAMEGHGQGFTVVTAPMEDRETISPEEAAQRDQQGGD